MIYTGEVIVRKMVDGTKMNGVETFKEGVENQWIKERIPQG